MILDFHTHKPTAEGVITPRCFGIHPWDADQYPDTIDPQPFEALATNGQLEWIGECGIDALRGPSLSKQIDIFKQQLSLAERLNKPVVIHCVRCWTQLLQLRKQFHATPWVVHGFTGPPELFDDLWRHDIKISVGAALLNPKCTKLHRTLQHAGPNHLLFETDDSDADIHDIYIAAANILGISTKSLCHEVLYYFSLINSPLGLNSK
ncbi:MAG: TatD family hydrolase [Bacteroidales bacterium]|nr:TatD family hydrolase [Candidatus Colimorpha onthohippi]